MGALLLCAEPGSPAVYPEPEKVYLPFAPVWKIARQAENALTLDTCRYKVDDGDWQPAKNILLIQQDLLKEKRPCRLTLEYVFQAEDPAGLSELSFVTETPDKYRISINGRPLAFKDEGWYTDRAFRRTSIGDYVKEGANVITMETEFFQRQKVYDVLFGENVHETERNKLCLLYTS